MNPFSKRQRLFRNHNWRAQLAFVLCFVTGLGLLAWRAKARLDTARAIARTEARAAASLIELQLRQAASTAEILGVLANQGRITPATFQSVASGLFTGHPGLDSLRLEPHGVVSDVVPRAGHEQAIGLNVLKDPGQRAGANEAISRRALTLTGPVRLDSGQPGIVARVPVFERTSAGRESFWGFVAVSMRLKDVLDRANLDEVWRHGYNYALFRTPSGPQKALVMAFHGPSSIQDTVRHPFRVQNLELGVALKPRSGWVNKTSLFLEFLILVLGCGLISVSASILESRRALEISLDEETQRQSREAQERKRAQEDCLEAQERLRGLQAELKAAQLGLAQAESRAEQVQQKLTDSEQARDKATQAHDAELKDAHEALKRALETSAHLKAQLESAAQAEKEAAEVAQEQLQREEATISELKARVEAAECSAREAASAGAAKMEQLEQTNRGLEAQLGAAEQAQARVPELERLLQAAQEELKQRQEDTRSAPGITPEQTHETVSRSDPEEGEDHSAVAPSAEGSSMPRAKTSRTRKTRRDNQLNLFGTEGAAVAAASEPKSASEALMREALGPGTETDSPAPPPASNQPQPPSAEEQAEELLQEASESSAEKPQPEPEGEREEEEGVPPVSGPHARERAHRLPAAPPVEPAQLRKACNLILPLLADRDPGAKDCLKDNRKTFRSTFTPEAYVQFEALVRNGDFEHALEELKKAARKHGIVI